MCRVHTGGDHSTSVSARAIRKPQIRTTKPTMETTE